MWLQSFKGANKTLFLYTKYEKTKKTSFNSLCASKILGKAGSSRSVMKEMMATRNM